MTKEMIKHYAIIAYAVIIFLVIVAAQIWIYTLIGGFHNVTLWLIAICGAAGPIALLVLELRERRERNTSHSGTCRRDDVRTF